MLKVSGAKAPIVWGANGGIQEIASAAHAKLNIAVSASGIKTVKLLQKKYGTPYLIGYPLGEVQTKKWKDKVQHLLNGDEVQAEEPNVHTGTKRALIMSEQLTGCALREMLLEEFGYGTVDVASFFKMDKSLMQENDLHMRDEAKIKEFLAKKEEYDLVIADPLCFPLLSYEPKKKVMLPHIAVSAIMFARKSPNIFGEKATQYFKMMLNE